jgi:hypothetical protein
MDFIYLWSWHAPSPRRRHNVRAASLLGQLDPDQGDKVLWSSFWSAPSAHLAVRLDISIGDVDYRRCDRPVRALIAGCLNEQSASHRKPRRSGVFIDRSRRSVPHGSTACWLPTDAP